MFYKPEFLDIYPAVRQIEFAVYLDFEKSGVTWRIVTLGDIGRAEVEICL